MVRNQIRKKKNICTKYINEFLLNDGNNTILIMNTIKYANEIIKQTILNFGDLRINEEDIKIVFKGGMNTRIIIREFNNIILKKVKIDNYDDDYKELKSILKQINKDSNNVDNINDDLFTEYSNIAKKSDLDFMVLINRRFGKDTYTKIKNYLISKFQVYMLEIQKKLVETNFFYTIEDTDSLKYKEFLKNNEIVKLDFNRKKNNYVIYSMDDIFQQEIIFKITSDLTNNQKYNEMNQISTT